MLSIHHFIEGRFHKSLNLGLINEIYEALLVPSNNERMQETTMNQSISLKY